MARRRQKQKESFLEDLFEFTAKFPWWVGVFLAALAYFWLHHYAVTEVVSAASPSAIGGAVISQVFKSLALVGQFVLPAILLLGALASAFNRAKNKPSPVVEPSLSSNANNEEPSLLRTAPSDDLYEIWKSAKNSESLRPDQWSLDLLRAIDWKRFEEVCAEYFRVCGFHATTQSRGPDGGIDIKLYAPQDHSKIVNIVQCKQWRKPIGPKAVREFLGVMTASKVPRGVFVASSTFNDEATRFAMENQIHLFDGRQFLDKIQERSTVDQTRLLKVATEGDYLTPSCPSCGIKLLKRESRRDSSTFWGCHNFPRCRFTLR